MDYSRFISAISSARVASPLAQTANLMAESSSDVINFGVAYPNDNLFPIKSANFVLQNGQQIEIDGDMMKCALQYGQPQGYAPLHKNLKSLAYKLHRPPNWSNTELIITAGGQFGLSKAIEMLINPGDYFITQEPAYPGAVTAVDPYHPRYITVDVDEYGMKPDVLLKKLEDERKKITDNNFPKALYVNPTGGNPFGTSLTFERKKEIYKIACDHDLIILEDDPYYFVQFEEEQPSPTFLSLDVEGRVIRFDSFSKIISSGLRMGYATGPKELIQRIFLHSQNCIFHPPLICQMMVNELLNHWGDEPFLKHTVVIREFYRQQRDFMMYAAEKHLKDLCKWNVPTGGMFLWLEVTVLKDTLTMIKERGIKNNVILMPGQSFLCDGKEKSRFLRASYSSATAEEMDEGFKNLAKMIREEVVLQDKK